MLSRTLLTLGVAVASCLAAIGPVYADNHTDTRGLGPAVASAHAISGTRRALVVGISRYQNLPANQQLEYADDDAEMMYAFLRSPAGGSTEQAVLLLDEQARAATIVQELARLRDAAQPGDEIIFYFAGHGDVERVVESAPGLLLGYDAPANGLYVANGGSVRLTFVREIMKEIVDKGARVIILTDACRAGSVNTSLESGAQLTSGALAREWQNVFRFVSSDADTLSEEDPELGHGVFTYYLLKGLLGEADGVMPGTAKDDQVSHREIDRYVTDQVYARTSGGQYPVLSGNPGRALSVVTPGVTWATLEQFVPARSEAEAQQYLVDRGLSIEQREARLESLTPEQRNLIEDFTTVLQSGRLVGDGGAVERYESMRGRIPSNYFVQHGDNLATALENHVQAFFSEHLSGEMRSDASESDSGDSLWAVEREEIEVAAEAMQAAVELRGATYATYPSMRSRLQFLRGWRAVVEGEYENAVDLLENVRPQSAFSLTALGYARFRSDQMDAAIEALSRAAELAPNWAEPVSFQGLVAQSRENYDAALALYRQAAAISPDTHYLQVYIGQVHALSDDLQSAMAAWRHALDIDAERSADTIANFMFGLQIADRVELAEGLYAEALMRDPDSERLHLERGSLYRWSERYDDAEGAFRQALRINPEYAMAHIALGSLYTTQRRLDEAADAYRLAAELVPDSALVWTSLAELYRYQEQYDEAISNYERALAIDPDDALAHGGLGRLYDTLEDYARAEQHLRLHAENSDSAEGWVYLGAFYEIEFGRFEDAVRAYERGLEIYPESSSLLANLGSARRMLGQFHEAAGAYRRALRYNPSQHVAIDGLEALEDRDIVPLRKRYSEGRHGRLDPSSAQEASDGSLFVAHELWGDEGEQWTIVLRSDAFDPWLAVYDGDVRIAEDNDDGPGLDASLTVTLPRSGEYTLVASTYSEGQYGDYEISILRERPEGHDFGRAQILSGELTTRSESRDGHRYRVHFVTAAVGELLDVTAASDSFDTQLSISHDGHLFAEDNDAGHGTNSRAVITAPVAGEYTVTVTSHEPEGLGEYSIAVRRGPIEESAHSVAAADGPELLSGTLSEYGAGLGPDNSPYAVHMIKLLAGDTIEITMQSSEFDAYLYAFDSYSRPIAEDDDSGGGTSARISFTAEMTGLYVIAASSADENANGAYTISLNQGR